MKYSSRRGLQTGPNLHAKSLAENLNSPSQIQSDSGKKNRPLQDPKIFPGSLWGQGVNSKSVLCVQPGTGWGPDHPVCQAWKDTARSELEERGKELRTSQGELTQTSGALVCGRNSSLGSGPGVSKRPLPLAMWVVWPALLLCCAVLYFVLA